MGLDTADPERARQQAELIHRIKRREWCFEETPSEVDMTPPCWVGIAVDFQVISWKPDFNVDRPAAWEEVHELWARLSSGVELIKGRACL